MLIIIALGIVAGAGLLLIIGELVPSQPRLDHALARLGPHNLELAATTTPETTHGRERIGEWLERHLAGRAGMTTPTRDLALIGHSSRTFWTDKGLCALIGLLIPSAMTALLPLAGLSVPLILPGGLALVLAGGFWFIPDLQIRSQAADARQEFVRASIAYLQLVAIQRGAGGGVADTITTAAEVSDAWMFVRIRQELARAQWAHVPPWDGLTRLGDTIGVPELAEVGDIMRLAAEAGAGVYDSLLARAAGLRNKLLSAQHSNANAATTSMSVPISLTLMVLLVALTYPAAMIILQ